MSNWTVKIVHCTNNEDDYYEDIIGKRTDFTGTGWGARDLGWCYKTKKAAHKAFEKLLLVRGLEVHLVRE